MSEQPTPSTQAPDVVEDFARAPLEHQMAALGRLGDIGMEMAENLGRIVARQAEAAEPDLAFDVPANQLAFDRTARAIRLTYALQCEVIDKLRGVGRIEVDQAERAERARAAEAAERQAQARAKAQAPVTARKLQISKAITGIIADAHEGDVSHQRLVREAERLRDHEVFDNVLGRPASEVIADICRLLGLEPNWEGLAFEAWAQEELESGKVGAPLRSPPPWMGPRPGVRGRLLKPEAPPTEESPAADDLPLSAETEDAPAPPSPEPEIADPDAWIPPPPYIPPPDPDILPGYEVGLPGELPPLRRDGRRARPVLPPRNYTYGFD